MSYLYVISSSKDGPCKLGLSENPEARLKQLQTGHPTLLQIYYQEPTTQNDVKALEHLLHRDINHLRQHGEWFKLSVEHAIAHVKFTIIRYADIENLTEKVRTGKIAIF